MDASGKGRSIGGCPDRERGIGLIDGAFTQKAGGIGPATFRCEELHHRCDEAIHTEGIDF